MYVVYFWWFMGVKEWWVKPGMAERELGVEINTPGGGWLWWWWY